MKRRTKLQIKIIGTKEMAKFNFTLYFYFYNIYFICWFIEMTLGCRLSGKPYVAQISPKTDNAVI